MDDPVVHTVRVVGATHHFPSPSAIFVEYRDGDELRSAARRLGVPLVHEPWRQLSESLVRIKPGVETSPPVRGGAPIEKWDAQSRRFTVFEIRTAWPSGLYRQEVFGRFRYALHSQDKWYKTNHAEGVYIIAGQNDELIRWRPDPTDPASAPGTLIVDNGVSLPDPQRRAVGLCTGLGPKIGKHSRNTRYDNVPRDIAEAVANSLRQPLTLLLETSGGENGI
ncbi:hypothetical protein [Rhodococcus jostii]|uniref:Uncharacterized protein n=1 Tax=Rhodococcus jostii TaxID=132919 RepID=A0ABU4CD66_RHOJO|nr:hypothetical protein [Rhodococcus jostii]MDV6281496.1 hypothetical protein [Rhodococcus jostii]